MDEIPLCVFLCKKYHVLLHIPEREIVIKPLMIQGQQIMGYLFMTS